MRTLSVVVGDARSRLDLERLLAASRRRQRAARHLWLDGQTAEGYRLAAEAFRATLLGLAAALRTGSQGEVIDVERELAALCGAEQLKALAATLADIETLSMPTSDADFGAAHAATLERLWQAQTELHRVIEQALGFGRRRRRLLIGLVFLPAALALAATWLAEKRAAARASASYSEQHGAARASDGLEATEWLLPDKQTGWLELELGRARPVREVQLLNAHNRHYNDRATRKFKLDLYDGGRLHASVEGEFEKFDPNPAWRIVPVPAGRVTRLRVSVLSHFKTGGGLAEVRVR